MARADRFNLPNGGRVDKGEYDNGKKRILTLAGLFEIAQTAGSLCVYRQRVDTFLRLEAADAPYALDCVAEVERVPRPDAVGNEVIVAVILGLHVNPPGKESYRLSIPTYMTMGGIVIGAEISNGREGLAPDLAIPDLPAGYFEQGYLLALPTGQQQ